MIQTIETLETVAIRPLASREILAQLRPPVPPDQRESLRGVIGHEAGARKGRDFRRRGLGAAGRVARDSVPFDCSRLFRHRAHPDARGAAAAAEPAMLLRVGSCRFSGSDGRCGTARHGDRPALRAAVAQAGERFQLLAQGGRRRSARRRDAVAGAARGWRLPPTDAPSPAGRLVAQRLRPSEPTWGGRRKPCPRMKEATRSRRRGAGAISAAYQRQRLRELSLRFGPPKSEPKRPSRFVDEHPLELVSSKPVTVIGSLAGTTAAQPASVWQGGARRTFVRWFRQASRAAKISHQPRA